MTADDTHAGTPPPCGVPAALPAAPPMSAVQFTGQFLGLSPVGRTSSRWVMHVGDHLCSSATRVYGGASLAGAMVVIEACQPRPLASLWVEFVRAVAGGQVVRLDASATEGRHLTRVSVVGRVRDRVVLRGHGVCIDGPAHEAVVASLAAPSVPPPPECPPRPYIEWRSDRISGQMDVRMARAMDASGRCVVWARVPGLGDDTSGELPGAPLIGLLADHVGFAVGELRGRRPGVVTLDLDLYLSGVAPTMWTLIELTVDAMDARRARGTARMWDETGALLGISSQRMLLR